MSKKINIQGAGLAPYYLNDTEEKIVRALSHNPDGYTIKELSTRTKKTRLTLLHSLNKLLIRGFVAKDQSGKAHVWRWDNKRRTPSPLVQEMNVEEAYEYLSKHTVDRIYAIQGSNAVKDEITRWKYGVSSIKKAHVSQKLKTTIVEGILSEDVLPLLRGLPSELKRSHYGRATNAHTIPAGSLVTPYDLLFSKGFVSCVYPKENYAIIIKSKPLAQTLISIYKLLCLHSKKINLGEIYK